MMRSYRKNYPILFLSLLSIFVICFFVSPLNTFAVVSSKETIDEPACEITVSIEEIEKYLTLNGIDYYAYMDINKAPEELKPIILEARTRIIYGEDASWVADDVDGYIKDQDGNIIEIVPHFHEVFPEDWEIPVRKCS